MRVKHKIFLGKEHISNQRYNYEVKMRNLILFSIAIYFLLLGCVNCNHNSQTNHYYINSQTGNDANNGISIN